jgi:hypothetical protein
VRQNSSAVQSDDQECGRDVTATDEHHAATRGIVHGVILSMVVWTAALYLILTLR